MFDVLLRDGVCGYHASDTDGAHAFLSVQILVGSSIDLRCAHHEDTDRDDLSLSVHFDTQHHRYRKQKDDEVCNDVCVLGHRQYIIACQFYEGCSLESSSPECKSGLQEEPETSEQSPRSYYDSKAQ